MPAQLQLQIYSFEDKREIMVKLLEEIYDYEPVEKRKKQKQKPISYYLN